MKSMKRVELITEDVYLQRLLDMFNKHKIDAYTLIRGVEGKGGHGLKMPGEVADGIGNDYIFTVCEEEKWIEMKEDIRAFETKYGGKCFVSDTMMLMH